MNADYKGLTSFQILPSAKARIEDIDLDSPRSLLACQRVGVLPHELNHCPEANIDEPDPEKRRIIYEIRERDRLMILSVCLNQFHDICTNGVTLAESIAFPNLVDLLPRSRTHDPRIKTALSAIQARYSLDDIEKRLNDKHTAKRRCCINEIINKARKEESMQKRMSVSANIVDEVKQTRQREMEKKMEVLLRRQEVAAERYHEAQRIADQHAISMMQHYQANLKNIEQNLKTMVTERQKQAAMQAKVYRKQQQAIESKRQEEEDSRMQRLSEYAEKRQQVDMRLQLLREKEYTKRMVASEKLNSRLLSAFVKAQQIFAQKQEQQRTDLKQRTEMAEKRKNEMNESRRDAIVRAHVAAVEAQRERLKQLEQERAFQDMQKRKKIKEENDMFVKRRNDRLATHAKIVAVGKLRSEMEHEIYQKRKERAERTEDFRRLIQSAYDGATRDRVAQHKEDIRQKAAAFREASFKVANQTDKVTRQARDVVKNNKTDVIRQVASAISKKPTHGEEDGLTKALSIVSSASRPPKRVNMKETLANAVKERLSKVPNDLYGLIKLAEKSGGFVDYASIRLVKPGEYKERILKAQQYRPRPTHSAPPRTVKFSTYEVM